MTVTRLPAERLQLINRAELPTFVCGMPSRPEVGHTPAFCADGRFSIQTLSCRKDTTFCEASWGKSWELLIRDAAGDRIGQGDL